MSLLHDTVNHINKKFQSEKTYIHLKISFGTVVDENCPCGSNIEITGRLRSQKSAIERKKNETNWLREKYSGVNNLIFKNRNRKSKYPRTKSRYTLYAHICDLKRCNP